MRNGRGKYKKCHWQLWELTVALAGIRGRTFVRLNDFE